MAKDQSNPPTQLITLEIARVVGQAHGETAFTAMVSPEIFEESIKVAIGAWRSAGFTCARSARMPTPAASVRRTS